MIVETFGEESFPTIIRAYIYMEKGEAIVRTESIGFFVIIIKPFCKGTRKLFLSLSLSLWLVRSFALILFL